MADSASEPRAKRPRVDKGGRFAALERLKQLKGSKNKYEVEDAVDNVYEIVDEKDYAKRAIEKYGTSNWIEDDGSGYAEDGRDFFEDEDYSDDEEQSTSKNKNKKAASKKRARDAEKPVKGKGSLRNLFSKAASKKAGGVSVKDDDILADILGELNDGPSNSKDAISKSTNINTTAVIAPTKIVKNIRKAEVNIEKDYLNSFMKHSTEKKKSLPTINPVNKYTDDDLSENILIPKKIIPNSKTVQQPIEEKKIPEVKTIKVTENEQKKEVEPSVKENLMKVDILDEDMDFSCLQEDENPFDEEITPPVEEKSPNKSSNITKDEVVEVSSEDKSTKGCEEIDNLLNNWERICQMDDFEEEVNSASSIVNDSTSSIVQENLKFWYWEAWEDSIKRPGEIFLFGKTAEGKSICVRVEKIDRVLYLLPRKYLLDPITKEPTNQQVTLADLYKEFDETIAVELNLESFRSRKVTKSFAYHSIGVDVPQLCDYMEVHYDGKKATPQSKTKYNSIAHIFGANTTSLESFLLDHKIKGPCWLNLKHFKTNTTPSTWCKVEVTVTDPKQVKLVMEGKPMPPPPITLLTLNVRTALNPKTLKNEICMISMLVHNRFQIDKPAPQPAFNRHMCGLTRPVGVNWPFDLNAKLAKYKSTKLFKHDSERALLSWFLAQYQQIDADLVVTYDALDCQLDVITDRIISSQIPQWSRMGRLRMSQHMGKKLLEFFIGRMVCDVKRSAEECIRARSYDLQTLCQNVLKLKENERMDVNNEDLMEMYETGDGILKLISLTMQDASYILRLMCDLNIMPLAMQITNICGNVMTRTLQGGRSERNEFLLLHAFTEKNYIVPDKKKREWVDKTSMKTNADTQEASTTNTTTTTGRKKAAYSGGLVLEPMKGLYDKYVLLMDFNSLYPSIIQEYNICFTTVQQPNNAEDLPSLPDSSVDAGILPQQLRRLVESRREVKKLMATPDLSAELQMQYHIRQMALKLTANSMYGCLGFGHSRFFAQHLAALVTHKGREILTNTKSLVQKLNYEVVYGDTDSIMINTNIVDYDQVFKIGHGIKQSVNKMYKQLELDIDGVFSCLLLLKKKKYAAIKLSKNNKGEIKKEQESKGLDIVRRDWSRIAIMIGKLVLDEILSEKQLDEKLDAVHGHLEKIKMQVLNGEVPLPMFIITKQLSKAPSEFNNASAQAHVQVAQRMNTTRNRRYKKGDMVDYVICDDGTNAAATQRAFHLDELKSSEILKLDNNYYLANQIHPVVTRMVEVLDGTDASRIAECLGLDPTKFRSAVQKYQQERSEDTAGESLVKTTLQRFRQCEKFRFVCIACKAENIVAAAFKPAPNRTYEAILEKCGNPDCDTAPHQYVLSIRNQLVLAMRNYIKRFYQNWLVCDDPACNQNSRSYSHVAIGNRPICMHCKNGTMVRQYSERDLYNQLSYFQYIFDLSKHHVKNSLLSPDAETAYHLLRETVEQQLEKSAYSTISLTKLFAHFKTLEMSDEISYRTIDLHRPAELVASTLADI